MKTPEIYTKTGIAPDIYIHALRCWPNFFNEIVSGVKKFEIRKDDRDFRVGDVLRLEEWLPTDSEDADEQKAAYTGRFELKVIRYILRDPQFGIQEGYAILGF